MNIELAPTQETSNSSNQAPQEDEFRSSEDKSSSFPFSNESWSINVQQLLSKEIQPYEFQTLNQGGNSIDDSNHSSYSKIPSEE